MRKWRQWGERGGGWRKGGGEKRRKEEKSGEERRGEGRRGRGEEERKGGWGGGEGLEPGRAWRGAWGHPASLSPVIAHTEHSVVTEECRHGTQPVIV
eukprot:3937329-Rhodomonas_salina.2